jgi:hypothetical protein
VDIMPLSLAANQLVRYQEPDLGALQGNAFPGQPSIPLNDLVYTKKFLNDNV